MRYLNQELPHYNGGPVMLTRLWARSVLEHMDFVKRKVATKAIIEPSYSGKLDEQYLLDMYKGCGRNEKRSQ